MSCFTIFFRFLLKWGHLVTNIVLSWVGATDLWLGERMAAITLNIDPQLAHSCSFASNHRQKKYKCNSYYVDASKIFILCWRCIHGASLWKTGPLLHTPLKWLERVFITNTVKNKILYYWDLAVPASLTSSPQTKHNQERGQTCFWKQHALILNNRTK